MNKYIKYLLVIISAFFFLESGVMGATIIETTKEDNYDTINEGSMIIGVTKFDSNVVLTASRVAKAGANDATLYAKKNNGVDGYEVPTIYVYYGVGGWYELDENNNASMVSDESLIDKLSKQEIYYVNNVEKNIDIDLNGINVDEERLPNGVSLKDNKLLVKATLNSFTVYTKDNKEVSYINNSGMFVINYGVCYTTSNGYITDYSDKCISDVILPEEINGEKIIGVKENAFSNKGITSVEISKNIMHLENNAFSNNDLKSVVIKDKYDKTDFTTYGNQVFGDFAEEKIIYDNDLTNLLKLFNAENKVKVRKGLSLEKWYIVTALMHNETKRLNIEVNKNYGYGDAPTTYVYDSKEYNFSLCYDSYCAGENLGDNEFILELYKDNKTVSKKITYEVEEVTVDSKVDEKVKNATKEIENYLKSTNEAFINGNYNTDLFDEKEVEKILSNNNLYGEYVGGGESGINTPLEINQKISLMNEAETFFLLMNDDVVIEKEYGIKHYYNISYDATNIEGEYVNISEKIDAAIKEFDEEIKLKDYEIIMHGDLKYNAYVTKDKERNFITHYYVSIVDANTNNSWTITVEEKEEEPLTVVTYNSIHNGVSVKNIHYEYYPSISFDDYDTTVEFKEAAIEKLANKIGVSDFSDYNINMNLQQPTTCKEVEGNYECKYEPDSNGIYEYHYIVYLYPKAGEVDGKLITYSINLYKYLDYEIINNETGAYEVEIDPNNYVGKADEYKNEAIKTFANKNNITDYEVLFGIENYYFSIKDLETGTFTRYNEPVNSDSTNIFMTYQVKDYSKDKTWAVYVPYNGVIYN